MTPLPQAAIRDGSNSVDVAIVVGTLDRRDQLRALVESIRLTVRTPWQLHVSDAGSVDGTREWLEAEASNDARIVCVFEESRSGQAAALNAIFRQVKTAYVCWLSDDNVLVGSGLDSAVYALRADPRLGMVGLKVLDRRGPFSEAPYIGGLTSAGVLNVNQGVLSAALVRQLGGFNEEFRDYGIDADLTTRILLAGYDVALTREVAVEHFRNWPAADTGEGKRLEARNSAYRKRYDQTFARSFSPSLRWVGGRALWKLARTVAPRLFDVMSDRTVLGRSARDWQNLLAGRFIRFREYDVTAPIYLRQHAPHPTIERKRSLQIEPGSPD